MIPAAFRYVRASSVGDACDLLRQHGDEAKVVAGGQSLLPLMKLRLAAPTVLVDLGGVAGLQGVRMDADTLVIGAMTTYRDVAASALVGRHAPVLARAAGLVGDPQVRNRGTIGGGVAHADPASDVSCALMALGASVVATGHGGSRRTIAVDELFVGFWTSVLGPDEVLTEIHVPSAENRGWDYRKFTIRAQDWAMVATAVCGERVALASMADRVVRASATEAALAVGASIDDAAAVADQGTEPPTDLRATAAYRRHLAKVLVGDALRTAQHTGR
jgi:carbon-monoxide dehydrogenase medium subunit